MIFNEDVVGIEWDRSYTQHYVAVDDGTWQAGKSHCDDTHNQNAIQSTRIVQNSTLMMINVSFFSI